MLLDVSTVRIWLFALLEWSSSVMITNYLPIKKLAKFSSMVSRGSRYQLLKGTAAG